MNLKQHLKPMLELESGSNDPMAYMLTIVLIDIISSGERLNFGNVVWDFTDTIRHWRAYRFPNREICCKAHQSYQLTQ